MLSKLLLLLLLVGVSITSANANAILPCPAGYGRAGDWAYQGCYLDDLEHREFDVNNFVGDNGYNADTCAAAVINRGWTCFSLQSSTTSGEFNGECYGSTTCGRYGPTAESNCNIACVGTSQHCGGNTLILQGGTTQIPWPQSLYSINTIPVWNRTCDLCPQGTHSLNIPLGGNDTNTKCTPAPIGTYGNGTSYVNCTKGTYASSTGQAACTPCDFNRGQVCPYDAMTNPIDIPAGYHVQTVTDPLSSVIPCTVGTWRAQGTSGASCTPCDLNQGQICPYQNMTSPVLIPAGYIATTASDSINSLTKCAIGTWRAQGTSGTTCTACNLNQGQVCPNQGMTNPQNIPAGYTAQTTSDSSFTPCPVGTSRSQGQPGTTCTPCAPGLYQDQTGQGSCKQAGVGMFAPGGTSFQTSCPVGTTTNGATGRSACVPCAIGKYAKTTGQAYCDTCTQGTTYQDQTGQAQCLTCPEGTFSYSPELKCVQCGDCTAMYTFVANQQNIGNLNYTASGSDWNNLVAANQVGIDTHFGKSGFLLQLKVCYNIGVFKIDDPKVNPAAQCAYVRQLPTPIPTVSTATHNEVSATIIMIGIVAVIMWINK